MSRFYQPSVSHCCDHEVMPDSAVSGNWGQILEKQDEILQKNTARLIQFYWNKTCFLFILFDFLVYKPGATRRHCAFLIFGQKHTHTHTQHSCYKTHRNAFVFFMFGKKNSRTMLCSNKTLCTHWHKGTKCRKQELKFCWRQRQMPVVDKLEKLHCVTLLRCKTTWRTWRKWFGNSCTWPFTHICKVTKEFLSQHYEQYTSPTLIWPIGVSVVPPMPLFTIFSALVKSVENTNDKYGLDPILTKTLKVYFFRISCRIVLTKIYLHVQKKGINNINLKTHQT